MEKTNSYFLPFDKPLLSEIKRIDKDYYEGKLDQLFKQDFDTDKAIELGQAMFETSYLIQNVGYTNLLTIVGIFSEICKERYNIDVTLNDFFRVQKIVKEQAAKYTASLVKHNTNKTPSHIG